MKYRLLVKPNARENRVTFDVKDSVYLVSVKARPVEGEANKEVLKIMADYLGLPKTSLELQNGSRSKYKTLIIE